MKRIKIVASLVTCVFCLSFLVVGVWAAVSVNFGFNSQLTFNPEGVYINVNAGIYRGANYGSLRKLDGEEYSYTSNNFDVIDGQPAGNASMTWENVPEISLVPGRRAVKYRVEVENVSKAGISGTATYTVNGATGSPTSSTTGGVTTTTYTNLTITEYGQYIKNIQPNATQVYELVIELNSDASSAEIAVNLSFTFTDDTSYSIDYNSDTYNFVNIGSYPQRYVGDVMNATLEELLLEPNNTNLVETGRVYTTFDGATAPTSTSATDSTPILVESKEYYYADGNTYVRMEAPEFVNASYTYMNGETVTASSAAWFKVEPIQWRILQTNYNSTGAAMLTTELGLASNMPFYPEDSRDYGDVSNYARKDNTLRSYLTTYFYNDALTFTEKANIVGRDFAEDELDNVSTGDSIVTALSDQKIWTPKYADYTSAINTGTNSMLCSPSDFAIANFGLLYINSGYTTASRQTGGTTNYWTPSATSNSYNGPTATANVAYIVYIGSSQTTSLTNSSTCARPAMLYNLASF